MDFLILTAVALDAMIGDPVYRWHPIRIMGRTLAFLENQLFTLGWNGLGGGILLTTTLLALFVLPVWGVQTFLQSHNRILLFAWNLYWVFHCFALRDLCAHAVRIARAAARQDLPASRLAVSWLVGRDTQPMDCEDCCRGGIESLSENLADGVLSPLFWYMVAGVPGMVAFKVVSTLDSMVGYKSPRYLYFGWSGARLDDLLNWIPARLTWLATAAMASLLPGYAGLHALRVGWRHHGIVPGPNSGWSEAAFAGALRRRLVGPLYQKGLLVNSLWLGDPADSTQSSPSDLLRAVYLAIAVTFFCLTLAIACKFLLDML